MTKPLSIAIVGAGMGAGLGMMQARVVRSITGRRAPWIWSSAGGLAIPFLLLDVARWLGRVVPDAPTGAVVAAGLTVGVWQAALLRAHVKSSGVWIAASMVGWALAGLAVATADAMGRGLALRGLPGALAYLGVIGIGGLALGVVTGVAMVKSLKHPPSD